MAIEWTGKTMSKGSFGVFFLEENLYREAYERLVATNQTHEGWALSKLSGWRALLEASYLIPLTKQKHKIVSYLQVAIYNLL